jgi:hypothetical protein
MSSVPASCRGVRQIVTPQAEVFDEHSARSLRCFFRLSGSIEIILGSSMAVAALLLKRIEN